VALREKYSYAIQTAKNLRFDGSAEERDGRLHFVGTVNSEDEKNQIWNAIKTIPDWQKEIVADIKVKPGARPAAQLGPAPASQPVATRGGEQTYTVQKGDTLSAIAKRFLGDANAYMDIFNANRDQLSDPDKIKTGTGDEDPAAHAHVGSSSALKSSGAGSPPAGTPGTLPRQASTHL
jgi:LysM repeat protein